MFKKMKIKAYLNSLGDDKSPFDLLLSDYISGAMEKELRAKGIGRISTHIDWHKDLKCIGIQGKYMCYYTYIDILIYSDEFSIAYDFGEADDGVTYPLVSRDQVYETLYGIIKTIHTKFS